MKKILILFCIALSACDTACSGGDQSNVYPEEVKMAENLCVNAGGLKYLHTEMTRGVSDRFIYNTVYITCVNSVKSQFTHAIHIQ